MGNAIHACEQIPDSNKRIFRLRMYSKNNKLCIDLHNIFQALTPEIVREFIEKIVVHERPEPYKKKNYTQQFDVYFNFVCRI